eukprot:GILJ01003140.1.p1 GENE.GILJ01003140.1~~GILJ01003140.1.p1  ORF type:complete len:454 (+),score=54.12 GILJ01003140.1:99-1460(+)
MEVTPGRGLGAFELGSTISDAIQQLQRGPYASHNVELLYSDQQPLSRDIVLRVKALGLQLRFDAQSQRLRLIDVFDFHAISLAYCGSCFNDPASIPARFNLLYALFGPTFPGEYNATTQAYCLNYPGISFLFPLPPQYQQLYTDGKELPVQFPDGTTPTAIRMFIYGGLNVRAPSLPPIPSNSFYYEPVHAFPSRGLMFAQRNRHLRFSSSVQHVCSELGAPSKICQKELDKMRIHHQEGRSGCPDFFYNYFRMGIDILFDGEKHTAKKFVLHTNYPGHVRFNQYQKCNFFIHVSHIQNTTATTRSESSSPMLPPSSYSQTHKRNWSNTSNDLLFDMEGEDEEQTDGVDLSYEQAAQPQLSTIELRTDPAGDLDVNAAGPLINSDMTWTQIQQILGPASRPLVMSDGGTLQPFGPTYFYAYHDIIFEVMKNDHIASVTFFLDHSNLENGIVQL